MTARWSLLALALLGCQATPEDKPSRFVGVETCLEEGVGYAGRPLSSARHLQRHRNTLVLIDGEEAYRLPGLYCHGELSPDGTMFWATPADETRVELYWTVALKTLDQPEPFAVISTPEPLFEFRPLRHWTGQNHLRVRTNTGVWLEFHDGEEAALPPDSSPLSPRGRRTVVADSGLILRESGWRSWSAIGRGEKDPLPPDWLDGAHADDVHPGLRMAVSQEQDGSWRLLYADGSVRPGLARCHGFELSDVMFTRDGRSVCGWGDDPQRSLPANRLRCCPIEGRIGSPEVREPAGGRASAP